MFPTDVDFETKVTLETEAAPLEEELPFHILLFGDWSGKESRSSKSSALNLSPIEIDRDNFNDVIRKLNAELDLKFPGSETALSIKFKELDDFHPDKIFQQLSLFAELRSVRQRLTKADSFDEAAIEVRSWLIDENSATQQALKETNSVEASQAVPDDLLNQILGKTDTEIFGKTSKSVGATELSAFVAKLVEPHIIQTDTAEQSKLLIIVDEVISDLMKKILHHPQFQALESAWRAVYLLVKEIETDASLKLFLFDISKDELAADLKSVSNLSDSNVCRVLTNEANEPWAMVCANYTFGLNVDDVSALIRLAKLGNATNTPFISHIQPEMFGFKSFASALALDRWQVAKDSAEGKLWEILRSAPDSKYLGLTLPRFLARLPYGEQTDPTEGFYFEEFVSPGEHEQYLWANPSFICALLIAQSFQQFGWNFMPNFSRDVFGLPMYLYKIDGETKTKLCAEVVMSESNCGAALNEGLTPLISFRDTDKIRVGRLQSISYSSSDLSGKWS